MSKRIISIDSDFFKIKKTHNKSKKNKAGANVNLKSLRKKILNELNTKNSVSSFKNNSFIKTKPSTKGKKEITNQLGPPLSKPTTTSLQDAFTQSMSFLDKQQDKNKTARVKRVKPLIKSEDVSLELPEALQEVRNIVPNSPIHVKSSGHANKEPAYGCMKGGVKPTYRTLNNTLKNNNIRTVNSPPPQPKPPVRSPPPQPMELDETQVPTTSNILTEYYRNEKEKKPVTQVEDSFKERSTVTDNLKLNTVNNTGDVNNNTIITEVLDDSLFKDLNEKQLLSQKDYHRKIHNRGKNHRNHSKFNRTYKAYSVKERVVVGKHPDGKVSVIINDNKTRRKTSELKKSYDTTPLREIRKYLQEVNLLEPGSRTPEDVLRTMYSNARMSGNIKNINKEAVIHGYLNNPGGS